MADEVQLNDITFLDGPCAGVSMEDGGNAGQLGILSDGSASKQKGKIGHRRIDKQGEVSYKRVPTNALMGAIQLGIANSVGSLAGKARRDILVQDFEVIESVAFPS
jgi:1-phosphatidylinositol-4-phosphate 5-kinase